MWCVGCGMLKRVGHVWLGEGALDWGCTKGKNVLDSVAYSSFSVVEFSRQYWECFWYFFKDMVCRFRVWGNIFCELNEGRGVPCVIMTSFTFGFCWGVCTGGGFLWSLCLLWGWLICCCMRVGVGVYKYIRWGPPKHVKDPQLKQIKRQTFSNI